MHQPLTEDWDREMSVVQNRIWQRKMPGEKMRMVDQLWRQARLFKRATLKSLHPDWDDARIDEAVWEAMSGRKRESL